jgi:carbon starvation protein CstA
MTTRTPLPWPWILVALLGAVSLAQVAVFRGESVNAAWLLAAAICTYLLAYRFYSAWVAAKVLCIDATRATPAERLDNGRDFVPTHKWVVFGHHFAAIAGPGPLIGPTLAAQFGYLPGTLWILVGGVLGGAVQDMVILFLSTRRDGRSLGQMARDELGNVGGAAALVGTFLIMLILIAVLGLEVFGVILAGYASASKWSLFGAMREAAQVVSYEVPLGMCVVVPVMLAGMMAKATLPRSGMALPQLAALDQFPPAAGPLQVTLASWVMLPVPVVVDTGSSV